MNREEIFYRKPLIYLITEGKTMAENFAAEKRKILNLVKIAADAKISLVQIREKNLPARLVFELTLEAAKIASRTETKILVNARADIALAARADGVHLTARSLAVKIIRRNFPPDFIVGASVHSNEEAEIARRQAADFVTFSPIFPTPDKEKFGAPQGLEKLREVCERLKPFPIIALGGIDENNYKSVLENGASGFAAIRFLNNAENLRKLTVN
ncbi:MAG: thiamine phosphate synthase [Acidobacteriota bacterium]|nr:thiamine phosphate synthase [Acidobacteriota bacterium]